MRLTGAALTSCGAPVSKTITYETFYMDQPGGPLRTDEAVPPSIFVLADLAVVLIPSATLGKYAAPGNPIRVAQQSFVIADPTNLTPAGIGPAAGATYTAAAALLGTAIVRVRTAARRCRSFLLTNWCQGNMPDPQPTSYTIVSWVRRGLASLISAASATNYACLPVTITVNGAPVNGPSVRLIGPGQITGLDPRAVIRTDPRDGAMAFEPNYLATMELAAPDLPWMFSPAPQGNGRVQPWICLIVVPDADGVSLERAGAGLSVLTIKSPLDPAAELPDLATIDSWTHAQVTGANVSGTDLTKALDGDPSTIRFSPGLRAQTRRG